MPPCRWTGRRSTPARGRIGPCCPGRGPSSPSSGRSGSFAGPSSGPRAARSHPIVRRPAGHRAPPGHPRPGRARPQAAAGLEAPVAELTERKEHLEGELARRSAAFRSQRAREQTTPGEVQAALPHDIALIDFLEYTDSSPPAEGKGQWKRERRLVAFVVRHDHPIVRLDLGPFEPIEQAIADWRVALGADPAPAKPTASQAASPAPALVIGRSWPTRSGAWSGCRWSRTWKGSTRCWSRPMGRWAGCRWPPCQDRSQTRT